MTGWLTRQEAGKLPPFPAERATPPALCATASPEAARESDSLTAGQALAEDLCESQQMLRLVVDTIPVRVFWKNRQSVYLGGNQLFAQDAGLRSPAELVGKTDHDLAWRQQAEAYRADDRMLMATGESRFHYEEPQSTPAGRKITLRTSKIPLRDRHNNIIGVLGLYEDITERRRAGELLRLQETALRATANVVVITDYAGRVVWTNPAFTRVTGYAPEEVLGQNPRVLKSGSHPPEFYQSLWQTISNGRVWHGEFQNRRKDGRPLIEDATITPVCDEKGHITHFIAVKQDITERKAVEQERALLEVQLRHAQKLESIGQLAAGIAHEINTPTQYVGDNLRFVQESLTQLQQVLQLPHQLLQAAKENRLTSQTIVYAEKILAEADLNYLAVEIPKAIEESLQGVSRVAKIVRAMKEFSHPGSDEKTLVDLNKTIESTLTVARNEWKYVADLELDFDPDLPQVLCLPGEFNQVILNLVVNAAHAIGDAIKGQTSAKGIIKASTRQDGDWVEVRIRDTGTGIPDYARNKIFEPFFTTKGVGKGTGQGLAIARSVIVDKHGGTIHFETETGQGTTFVIRLPLNKPTPERPRP